MLKSVCPDFCDYHGDGGGCSGGQPPNGVILVGCMSLNAIASHLTHSPYRVKTLTDRDHWQASQVRNLFREEREALRALKGTQSKSSKV
ncbi:hypothetical protein GCM10027567_00960 [Spongiibacter taiwanensis]